MKKMIKNILPIFLILFLFQNCTIHKKNGMVYEFVGLKKHKKIKHKVSKQNPSEAVLAINSSASNPSKVKKETPESPSLFKVEQHSENIPLVNNSVTLNKVKPSKKLRQTVKKIHTNVQKRSENTKIKLQKSDDGDGGDGALRTIGWVFIILGIIFVLIVSILIGILFMLLGLVFVVAGK